MGVSDATNGKLAVLSGIAVIGLAVASTGPVAWQGLLIAIGGMIAVGCALSLRGWPRGRTVARAGMWLLTLIATSYVIFIGVLWRTAGKQSTEWTSMASSQVALWLVCACVGVYFLVTLRRKRDTLGTRG